VQLSILTLVRLCALLIGRERERHDSALRGPSATADATATCTRVGLHHVAGRVADMPTRRQWSSRRFPKC